MNIIEADINPPKKFKKFGKLPGKPSELIRLAIKDLKAIEKTKKFEIAMDEVFLGTFKNKCAVCFAGAVMCESLKTSKVTKEALGLADIAKNNFSDFSKQYASPRLFEKEEKALEALDCFRNGILDSGFHQLDLEWTGQFKMEVSITPYSTNKTKFKKDMEALANALEKEGY